MKKQINKGQGMIWQDVFTPPFHHADYLGDRVYDSKDRFCLNTFVGENDLEILVQKLNAKLDRPLKLTGFYIDKDNPGDIKLKDKLILRVRGWGRLTGTGGLNLEGKEAARLQDDFAAWVILTLNS